MEWRQVPHRGRGLRQQVRDNAHFLLFHRHSVRSATSTFISLDRNLATLASFPLFTPNLNAKLPFPGLESVSRHPHSSLPVSASCPLLLGPPSYPVPGFLPSAESDHLTPSSLISGTPGLLKYKTSHLRVMSSQRPILKNVASMTLVMKGKET